MFNLNEAGKFRANPAANLENNLKLVDPNTPGTPATDSGTIDVSAATTITGVKYTGKDGASAFISFFNEDQLTQKRSPVTIAAGADPEDIQTEVYKVVSSHEVDAIVSVTKAADVLTVEHTGSGTLSALVVDGSDSTLSRASIAVVSLGATVKTKAKKK